MRNTQEQDSPYLLPKIDPRNNFDLLRLIFATSVFLYHVSVLSQHPDLRILKGIFKADFALNAFFIISGFLVFMSYENSGTVILYFEKRLRRIYPAYLAIVLLCALLGFFLSSYSFTEYYLSRTFMRYIAANVFFLNFLEPGLPGVFVSNHLGAINGSLWTIRTEVLCYVLVPFLVYFLRRYNRLAVFLLMYTGAYIVYALLLKNAHSAVHPYLVKMYYVPWHFLCFMSGAVCYYFSDTFRSRPVLFLLPALVLYIGGWTANITILEPVSLAVLVVSAACFFPYLGNFARFGDMSYGVYIFHFPIVQILISRSIFNTSPIFGLIIAFFLVFLLAFISWHMLERPFLKRSSHYLLMKS